MSIERIDPPVVSRSMLQNTTIKIIGQGLALTTSVNIKSATASTIVTALTHDGDTILNFKMPTSISSGLLSVTVSSDTDASQPGHVLVQYEPSFTYFSVPQPDPPSQPINPKWVAFSLSKSTTPTGVAADSVLIGAESGTYSSMLDHPLDDTLTSFPMTTPSLKVAPYISIGSQPAYFPAAAGAITKDKYTAIIGFPPNAKNAEFCVVFADVYVNPCDPISQLESPSLLATASSSFMPDRYLLAALNGKKDSLLFWGGTKEGGMTKTAPVLDKAGATVPALATDDISSLFITDLNNDGYLDLATLGKAGLRRILQASSTSLSLSEEKTVIKFKDEKGQFLTPATNILAILDVDGDKLLDFIVADNSNQKLLFFDQDGNQEGSLNIAAATKSELTRVDSIGASRRHLVIADAITKRVAVLYNTTVGPGP